MLLLDENFPASQVSQLRKWRFRVRVVGIEVGDLGIKDDNIIPHLHAGPRITFLTLDRDFHQRHLLHPAYAIAWLDVADGVAAEFVRRYLRHPSFGTASKRLGTVSRVHSAGVDFWQVSSLIALRIRWTAH